MLTKNRWQEWVNMALGIWLFVSPFYGIEQMHSVAAYNSYVFGAIIVLLSASALLFSQIWEEWINMAIGLWLFVAPLALGLTANNSIMLNQIDVGVTLFGIALWAAVAHPPFEGHRDVEHALPHA